MTDNGHKRHQGHQKPFINHKHRLESFVLAAVRCKTLAFYLKSLLSISTSREIRELLMTVIILTLKGKTKPITISAQDLEYDSVMNCFCFQNEMG